MGEQATPSPLPRPNNRRAKAGILPQLQLLLPLLMLQPNSARPLAPLAPHTPGAKQVRGVAGRLGPAQERCPAPTCTA